jgi:hypothetical protein
MINIHALPNEVLLNIFRLGCADPELNFGHNGKPDEFGRPCHARRRKNFIAVSRLACFRWQQLVDLSNLPYGSHFWFARLTLALCEDPSNRMNECMASPNLLRDRLIQIRKFMSTSQGCDLFVVLDGKVSRRKVPESGNSQNVTLDSYEDISPGDQLSVKLFLHGALDILRQQNQVFAIVVQVENAPMHKHMVELFANWLPAPRLRFIHINFLPRFLQTSPPGYTSLEALASSTSIPGLGVTYLPALHLQEPFGQSLVKFAHIDKLSIPSPWLQALVHHITIKDLTLGMWDHSEVVRSATTFLHSPFCANLQQLNLDCAFEPLTMDQQSVLNTWKLPTISFPRLKSLEIYNMDDLEAYFLLLHVDCPQLTSAILLVSPSPGFLTHSGWAPTNQNQFPLLSTLEIRCQVANFALDSLYLLDIFKHSPVHKLTFWNKPSMGKPETTNESIEMVMGILSHFKPDDLMIEESSLEGTLLILGGLDVCNLQKASMGLSVEGTPSAYDPFKQEWTPQVIDLPHLSLLWLAGPEGNQLFDLFQWINAEALETLKIYFDSNPGEIEDLPNEHTAMETQETEDIMLPCFPSLHTMEVNLSSVLQGQFSTIFLLNLWEMSPNLKQLLFTGPDIDASPNTLPNLSDFIFSSLNLVHASDASTLGDYVPAPVPLLAHLKGTWPVMDPDTLGATDHEMEAARNIIVKHLASRHEKGAVFLELTEFCYSPEKMFQLCAKKYQREA